MTAITDKKLRDQIKERKDTIIEELKKTEYVREEEQKEHNTRSSDIVKRETSYQRRTDTKNGTIRNKAKNKNSNCRQCRYCCVSKWSPPHECYASEVNCNKCGKKRHYAKACRQKFNNRRTVKKITEEETTELTESSHESNESIHHINEIKKIEETNKH